MVTRSALVALAFTALLPQGHAHAQTGSLAWRRKDSEEVRRLQARLRHSDRIRVRAGSRWVELWYPFLEDGTINYTRSAQDFTSRPSVSLADVSEIQARGSAAGTGAAIGGVIGSVGGLVAGAVVGIPLFSGEMVSCCSPGAVAAVVGALGGMAGGALVGGLVGWPIKKWKTTGR